MKKNVILQMTKRIKYKFNPFNKVKIFFDLIYKIYDKNKKSASLKLIELNCVNNDNVSCIIQPFGYNQKICFNVIDLIQDDQIYKKFSKDDQSILLWAAGYCKYTILSIDTISSIPTFTIEADCEKTRYVKKFNSLELIKNKRLLEKLPILQKKLVKEISLQGVPKS